MANLNLNHREEQGKLEETSAKFGLILMHLMRREDRERRSSIECLFKTKMIILQHKGTAHPFRIPSELAGTKFTVFPENSRGTEYTESKAFCPVVRAY